MSRSLLILSCSRRKREGPGLLPAIERYDGPAFRVLRRFLRSQPAEAPDIYVLSAAFGLLPCQQPIPVYDRLMAPSRARELQPSVLATLRDLLGAASYREVFLCLGQTYLLALDDHGAFAPRGLVVRVTRGGLGKRLAELYDWLYGNPPELHLGPRSVAQQGRARLRGIEVAVKPDQVLAVARRALTEHPPEAARYHSWYVPVDGQRVAPKWLVSQLVGLPVSAFTTDEARRVLAQLGVEVRRA